MWAAILKLIKALFGALDEYRIANEKKVQEVNKQNDDRIKKAVAARDAVKPSPAGSVPKRDPYLRD